MGTNGVNNNTNTKTNIAAYAMMPAMTLTLSAGHGIKGARGIKNAVKLQNNKGFKNFYNSLEGDVFTKSLKVAQEYDKHKELVKNYNKWNNKLNHITKTNGKLGLKDRFFNLFKSKETKLTTDVIKNEQKAAKTALSQADEVLDSAQALAKGAKGAKITKEGLEGSFKTLFKKEITSKFNIALTALTFIPNIKDRVIPAFKEQGFKAGMKETGKVLIQAGTDLISYGIGGAIGRVIGCAIGTVCPALGVGVSVLAGVGDMIGSMVIGGKVTKTVDKLIGADEETEEKLKEERAANQAAKEALAYTPNAPQATFDKQF